MKRLLVMLCVGLVLAGCTTRAERMARLKRLHEQTGTLDQYYSMQDQAARNQAQKQAVEQRERAVREERARRQRQRAQAQQAELEYRIDQTARNAPASEHSRIPAQSSQSTNTTEWDDSLIHMCAHPENYTRSGPACME